MTVRKAWNAMVWILLLGVTLGTAGTPVSAEANSQRKSNTPWPLGRTRYTPGDPEIVEKRTRFSKCLSETWEGAIQRVIWLAPVHYGDGGLWRDIDTRIVALECNGQRRWGCLTNGLKVIFREDRQGRFVFDLVVQEDTLRVRPASLISNSREIGLSDELMGVDEPVVAGNRIAFSGVTDSMDVAFTILPDGLRTDLVIARGSLLGAPGLNLTYTQELSSIRGVGGRDPIHSVNVRDGSATLILGNARHPHELTFRRPRLWDGSSGEVCGTGSSEIIRAAEHYDLVGRLTIARGESLAAKGPIVLSTWVELDPTDDAYIASGHPYNNHGSYDRLVVGYSTYQGYGYFRSLLKFNLSSIPAGASVDTAYLYAYMFESEGGGGLYTYAHRIIDDWTEDTVTWADGIRFTYYSYDVRYVMSTARWYSWDIVTMVNEWVNGTWENYGVMLKGSEDQVITFNRKFHSKECGCVEGPYLKVVYTPPPPPDLIVDELSFTPSDPWAGEPITVTLRIKNEGAGPASGRFWTDFYRDLSGPPSPGDLGQWYDDLSYLGPGETHTWQFEQTSLEAGIWHMYAQVDTDSTIDEGNENNNVYGPVDVYWAGKDSASASYPAWSGWWWPFYEDTWPNLYDDPGPLTKYDFACNQGDSSWWWEYRYHRTSNPDSDCTGHCDPWVYAAMNEEEPVVVQGDFSVGDQKGLLTECWCDIYDEDWRTDPPGNVPFSPGSLWDWLILTIRDGYKGLYMTGVDNHFSWDPGTNEVWTHPVYRYRFKYRPGADGKYDGYCTLWYAGYASQYDPDFVGTIEVVRSYLFEDLEVDGTGHPLPRTGEWTGNTSGDPNDFPEQVFVASNPMNKYPELELENPHVDYSRVQSIVTTGSCGVGDSEAESGYDSDWRTRISIWPSPARSRFQISFRVPGTAMVTIDVYDIRGRFIDRIVKSEVEEGMFSREWNCRNANGGGLASGVYFVKLSVGEEVTTRKLVVIE